MSLPSGGINRTRMLRRRKLVPSGWVRGQFTVRLRQADYAGKTTPGFPSKEGASGEEQNSHPPGGSLARIENATKMKMVPPGWGLCLDGDGAKFGTKMRSYK